jgi:hypothetical protein
MGMVVSSSPFIVLVFGTALILIVGLLWRPGEPPVVLLLPVLLQFTEVALKPVTAALTDTPLQDLADFGSNLQPAGLFGLAGVIALALGLHIGARASRASIKGVPIPWPFQRILAGALAAIVAGHAFAIVARSFGGASQIILALSQIRCAGLFVLAYSVLSIDRGRWWLTTVVGVELVLGMSGFFGDFRMVLLVLLTAAMASAQGKLRISSIFTLALGSALMLVLAVFWSSIKIEYRDFLNKGTKEQVVLQPLDARLGFLAGKAIDFDGRQFADGLEKLSGRLSYIDFLAATMERVPDEVPHEGGALLGAAVWHIVTPRILFPDKPEVPSDTAVTAYYTGVETVLTNVEATSISIGYLGELYIDFGIAGALIAVVLIGFAFGRLYRAIRDYSRLPAVINYSFCMMLAIPMSTFGMALIKLIGGFVMVAAVAMVSQRVIGPVLSPTKYARGSNRVSLRRTRA